MAVDIKRFQINTTVSVTNIQCNMTTLVHSCSEYEQYFMCDNPVCDQNRKPRSITNFQEKHVSFDTESHDEGTWLVPSDPVENSSRTSRDSYVNDDELKEVFTQLEHALVSTSNSEVTLDRVSSKATVESSDLRKGSKTWDTERWKDYYRHLRGERYACPGKSNCDDNTQRSEISSQLSRDRRRDIFENFEFNRALLEQLKIHRTLSIEESLGFDERDTTERTDETKSSKDENSMYTIDDENDSSMFSTENEKAIEQIKPPKVFIENRFPKNKPTYHETWVFRNLSPEQIEGYRKHQELKQSFTPAFISNRVTNKLKHTEVYQAIKPRTFERLNFKFRPHMKFPVFGEGKYATTAVSKNYTFTPTEQMSINRANYILDQRIKEMKNRKSDTSTSAKPIRFDQSSSYINRMKDYERIHMENQKLVKKFNPNNIPTTHQLGGYRKSATSFGTSSSKSGKSTASQFSSRMYTSAYDKKTVQKLAHSQNQYATNKCISKKHKRPEWDAGHVDYRKPDVKPVKYKSIRKLPVIVANSNITIGSTATNCNSTGKSKTSTVRSKIFTVHHNSVTKNNGINQMEISKENKFTVLKNVAAVKTQDNLRKSKIPVRQCNKSKSLDLNDKKFDVFQSLNKELFGAHENEKRDKKDKKEEKNEMEQLADEESENETREDTNETDSQRIVNLEVGGGDVNNLRFSDNNGESNQNEHYQTTTEDATEATFEYRPHCLAHDNFDCLERDDTLSNISSPSPRYLSPIRQFTEEAPVMYSALSNHTMKSSFSNALDIISEKTEYSSMSDSEDSHSAALNVRLEELLRSHQCKAENRTPRNQQCSPDKDNSLDCLVQHGGDVITTRLHFLNATTKRTSNLMSFIDVSCEQPKIEYDETSSDLDYEKD